MIKKGSVFLLVAGMLLSNAPLVSKARAQSDAIFKSSEEEITNSDAPDISEYKDLPKGLLLMANDAPQAADSFAPGDEEGKNICDLDDCLLYYNQKNYAAALPGLVAASRKDNIKAKEILGLMYKAGQGVPKDIERAFDLLFSAAEQGSPLAQRYVGTMLSEGTGVRKNPVLALTWLEIATASTTGAAKKEVARDRDIVASQLSRQERQAALDNAKRWFARRGQGYLLKLNRQD